MIICIHQQMYCRPSVGLQQRDRILIVISHTHANVKYVVQWSEKNAAKREAALLRQIREAEESNKVSIISDSSNMLS